MSTHYVDMFNKNMEVVVFYFLVNIVKVTDVLGIFYQ